MRDSNLKFSQSHGKMYGLFYLYLYQPLRIRLYVLRIRDYPYIPILFRMGLEPENSYSREGSGFLGNKNKPNQGKCTIH